MSKFISVISGDSFFQDGRFYMPSSVKTDWKCTFDTLVFAQSDVTGKPSSNQHQRVGMPVSSLCKALIYDQRDVGLSLRLAAAISDM